jgi:hypothetical protein
MRSVVYQRGHGNFLRQSMRRRPQLRILFAPISLNRCARLFPNFATHKSRLACSLYHTTLPICGTPSRSIR